MMPSAATEVAKAERICDGIDSEVPLDSTERSPRRPAPQGGATQGRSDVSRTLVPGGCLRRLAGFTVLCGPA